MNIKCCFASDNVLQAIQINGVKDSYNIILKSDDTAELQKTVQAPDKIILTLKGIRASKTINTIYNNTSSIDSVVVEPTGEDSVKILVQGQNVGVAEVNFDSLKTPLGVLSNEGQASSKANGELVLSKPVDAYTPVYNQGLDEEDLGFSLDGFSIPEILTKILKSEKLSWLAACGLLIMFILTGIKSVKGKDDEIQVGLSQSLKEREVELYKGLGGLNIELPEPPMAAKNGMSVQKTNASGSSYGIKAYQDGMRSPYVSSEIQRPKATARPKMSAPQSSNAINTRLSSAKLNQGAMTMTMPKTAAVPRQSAAKAKTTNIDSIKFLESMTKIYEKNGRTDLAQGLKANMKKAKLNLV